MRKSVIVAAVVLVALFAAAAAASADIATFNGVGTGSQVASNTANPVKVQAEVKPKITLAIETPAPSQVVTFGAVYPGTAPATQDVSMTVESNKNYDGQKSVGGQFAEMGLGTTLWGGNNGSVAGELKPGATYSDTYSLNVPYSTDPGTYEAYVYYTVTQNP